MSTHRPMEHPETQAAKLQTVLPLFTINQFLSITGKYYSSNITHNRALRNVPGSLSGGEVEEQYLEQKPKWKIIRKISSGEQQKVKH